MLLIDTLLTHHQTAICREVQCVELSQADRQINRMKSLKHIEYWLWCMWDNCWRPKYDCMWLVIGSLNHVGKRKSKYVYGETFARENKMWLHEWVKWDYLFMKNLTGEFNHIAIITQPFDGKWYRILDTYEFNTRVSERYVPLNGSRYAGLYEIIIARF